MKLELVEITHIDDVTFPIKATDTPVSFRTGHRASLWAEDQDGRRWVKEHGSTRWMPTSKFSSEAA